jgi:hypothetical protein
MPKGHVSKAGPPNEKGHEKKTPPGGWSGGDIFFFECTITIIITKMKRAESKNKGESPINP